LALKRELAMLGVAAKVAGPASGNGGTSTVQMGGEPG